MVAVSPKYKAQFYGLISIEGQINIPNVSAESFEVFLQFFYMGRVKLTEENIESVLDLVKQSLVEEFENTCMDFIIKKLIPNNFCEAFRLSLKYNLKKLNEKCVEKIMRATKVIITADDFLKCNQNLLKQILKINKFNCSELEVFNACIVWAREKCTQNGFDDCNVRNLREVLGDAIYQIRFTSFYVGEFATIHKSLSGFFTPDEAIEIIYLIGHLPNFKPKMFNKMRRLEFNNPYILLHDSDDDNEVID